MPRCAQIDYVKGGSMFKQIEIKVQAIQSEIDRIADIMYRFDKDSANRLKVQVLNLGFVRADIDRAAEIMDSKRSGQGDEPPCMEPNGERTNALLVSDDAQRVTAPNKSQPENVTPSCYYCKHRLSTVCKTCNWGYGSFEKA
jgi:hypothetical protein